MKELIRIILIVIVAVFIFMCVVLGFASLVDYKYYEREVRSFNKINNTEFSVDEWRAYSFEIKRLYPFVRAEK